MNIIEAARLMQAGKNVERCLYHDEFLMLRGKHEDEADDDTRYPITIMDLLADDWEVVE